MKTEFGDLKIQGRDGDEFEVEDVNTGEETSLSHDALVDVMQGSVFK